MLKNFWAKNYGGLIGLLVFAGVVAFAMLDGGNSTAETESKHDSVVTKDTAEYVIPDFSAKLKGAATSKFPESKTASDLKAERDFVEPKSNPMDSLPVDTYRVETPTPTYTPPPAIDTQSPKDSRSVSPDAESERLYNELSPKGKHRPTEATHTDFEHVEYFNPNTGTRSDYDLEVERDADWSVIRVDFENGGWLEIDGDTVNNGGGTETYTTSRGYEYTITKPSKIDD